MPLLDLLDDAQEAAVTAIFEVVRDPASSLKQRLVVARGFTRADDWKVASE